MIIKYIWHDRHCTYGEKKNAFLSCLLCTAVFHFCLLLFLFFWLQPVLGTQRVGKCFIKILVLFFGLNLFGSWHNNKHSLTHSFNAKFSAGKVVAWNQKEWAKILNLTFWCARVLYAVMMFMTSFLQIY